MEPRQKDIATAVEELARSAYDSCNPDDSFDDLKHRAAFSKEDRYLLRDWLAAAKRELSMHAESDPDRVPPLPARSMRA